MRSLLVLTLGLVTSTAIAAPERTSGLGFTLVAPPTWKVIKATDDGVALIQATDVVANVSMLPAAYNKAATDAATCTRASADVAQALSVTSPSAALRKAGSASVCEITGQMTSYDALVVIRTIGKKAMAVACTNVGKVATAWDGCRAIAASIVVDPKAKPAPPAAASVTLEIGKDGATRVRGAGVGFIVPKGWKVAAGTGDLLFSATMDGVSASTSREKRAFEPNTTAKCDKLGAALAGSVGGTYEAKVQDLPTGPACAVVMTHAAGAGLMALTAGPDHDLLRFSCQMTTADRARFVACGEIFGSLTFTASKR